MRGPGRTGALWFVAALILVGLVAGRAVRSSNAELAQASAYRDDGDLDRAITHYRRAIRWHVPGTDTRQAALASLREIATQQEGMGDTARALAAWRAIAAGTSATRTFFVVTGPERQEATGQIARLMATGRRVPIDAGLEQAALEEEYLASLNDMVVPEPVWAIVLLLGFGVWVGGLVWLTRRGFDARGRLQRRAASRPLVLCALGLAAFVLGMVLA